MNQIDKRSSEDYILDRTFFRPREAIIYLNECFARSVGSSRINVGVLRQAQGRLLPTAPRVTRHRVEARISVIGKKREAVVRHIAGEAVPGPASSRRFRRSGFFLSRADLLTPRR